MNTRKVVVSTVLAGGLLTTQTKAAELTDVTAPYPLNTCAVTGEKLGGGMGQPYVFTHQGREIKFCCQGCLKTFHGQPVEDIKKLEASRTTQTEELSGLKRENLPDITAGLASSGNEYTFAAALEQMLLTSQRMFDGLQDETKSVQPAQTLDVRDKNTL